jgi:hypothetical protein
MIDGSLASVVQVPRERPSLMFSRIRAEWNELKKAEPGTRFQAFHDRQQERMPGWARPLYIGGAIVSLGVGVILAFIPGPAVLFFALSAALLAAQSAWLAKKLDRAEVATRKLWSRLRRDKAGSGQTSTKPETPRARARTTPSPPPSASRGAAE